MRFWADELRAAGLAPSAQLMWMGQDDELNSGGLRVIATNGRWALAEDTMVLGPWVIKKPSKNWVCDHLIHPTYLNLTDGQGAFENMSAIIDSPVRKSAGVRARVIPATAPKTEFVTESEQPIVIVYGRANSDRATFPTSDAQNDDRHLFGWLSRYAIAHPRTALRLLAAICHLAVLRARVAAGRASIQSGDWVVRG